MNYFLDSKHGQLAVATTPSSFAADILFLGSAEWDVNQESPVKIVADLRDMNGDMMTMKQPRVITQCSDTAASIQGQDTDNPYYDFRILRLFYPQFNFTVPKAVFQDSLDNGTYLGMIDVNEYLPDSVNTSVAIWTHDGLNLSICLVDARWVATDAWILPLNAGSKIEHSLTINTKQTTTYGNVSSTSGDLIRIDPAWGNLLNHSVDGGAFAARASGAQSVFGLLIRYLGSSGDERAIRLASGLIIVLTAALAAVSGSRPWLVEWHSEGSWKPNPNYYQDKLPFQQLEDLGDYALLSERQYENVYSYNFAEITTILSWVVLLSHYLLVLVHLIVLYVNRGRASKRWERLGEVMCLALNSRRTNLLTNASAGVKGSKIWGLNATVREVGTEGRVELVIRDSKTLSVLHDHGMIQPDRKYG